MILAYMGYYYRFYDPTYILIVIGVVISLAASHHVNATYRKYSKYASASGLTGAQVAERILRSQGIMDVTVHHVSGNLTDHYNPMNKTVNLSDATYNSRSIAALGVAAHECGHAAQHAKGYAPLHFRTAILPFANLGSKLSWILIIVGIMIPSGASQIILNAGIFAFSLAVLFQILTLPVEFNASSRAMKILETNGILGSDELKISGKVLQAAALTYVAAAASSILQLLRLVILYGGNRRRR